MSIIRLSKMSAFGQNARPSDGAFLYIFEVGTTTPKTTYSDVEETIAQTHPVVADGAGVFAPVYLSGFYKEVLKDKNDTQISSVDGLQARAGDVSYLGDFDSSTNAGDYPPEGNLGDQYRVSTGFTLNSASGSHVLQTGDFILANTNGATAVDADWDIIRGVGRPRITTSFWHTTNGYGSSSTNIPKFTTAVDASDDVVVTIVNSVTSGFTITANMPCELHISYSDNPAINEEFGISKNSSELTTSIVTITTADRLAISAGLNNTVAWSGKVAANDVIRPHTSGGATTFSVLASIHILAKEIL